MIYITGISFRETYSENAGRCFNGNGRKAENKTVDLDGTDIEEQRLPLGLCVQISTHPRDPSANASGLRTTRHANKSCTLLGNI